MKATYVVAVVGIMSMVAMSAQALNITPSWGTLDVTRWELSLFPPSELSAEQVAGFVGYDDSLTLVYKSDYLEGVAIGDDDGDYADSYETTFSPPAQDPDSAWITYVAPLAISGDAIYLHVKDGAANPNHYIFDISGWNGTDMIVLSGFWSGTQGSISHVSILTGGEGELPPVLVPDGGMTLLLMGLGLAGLAIAKRMVV